MLVIDNEIVKIANMEIWCVFFFYFWPLLCCGKQYYDILSTHIYDFVIGRGYGRAVEVLFRLANESTTFQVRLCSQCSVYCHECIN